MIEKTVMVKVPRTDGKESTFTLEGGVVTVQQPITFGFPRYELDDLRKALDELAEA
jgi:hypothetical protein